MNNWLKRKTGGDPAKIWPGYRLNGNEVDKNNYYLSMAFIGPWGVGAMVDSAHQSWLNSVWDLLISQSPNDEDYYGNTLKLLSMIVMSGNWWSPENVAIQSAATSETSEDEDNMAEEFSEVEGLPAALLDAGNNASQTLYLPLMAK